MSNENMGPIVKLAEAHEQMAAALREISELGITVPKKALAPEPERKPLVMEDVRGVLAEKSRQGHTAAIKEIMAGFGAKKLSEVKPEDYQALLDAVEGLTDA